MIFGNLGGLKLPDICLTGEEKPQKNLTQETCRTRARCVTSAHATTCSTAVDFFLIMIVTDLVGRTREQERQSWMLGNFTFTLPGSRKLPTDCECSHLKTSILIFFPFLFWLPFPGYCGPALSSYFNSIILITANTKSHLLKFGDIWHLQSVKYGNSPSKFSCYLQKIQANP